MLKVRRTLTQILLEVTTEEMTSVAQEVYQKARAKGTSLYKILELVLKQIFSAGLYQLSKRSKNIFGIILIDYFLILT